MADGMRRPVVLVTGASRRAGIGAAVAQRLARSGWDVALTYWQPYDERMEWRSEPDDLAAIEAGLHSAGARTLLVPDDLADVGAPERILDAVTTDLGTVTALVLCHCESVDSGLRDTSVESFDRHYAVNARASWLLVREFARQFVGVPGSGRIVALTSDATVANLPYGASKAALDRIVIAAARELAGLGVTANVVNPGPTDTGWMSADLADSLVRAGPLGRLATPDDAAALVAFLCSPDGGWVNGQLLHSDGGLHT
jgi:3-oxoacyl-[acyl-carrier protein] reductase